jgi:hypothetical protein
MPFRFSVPAVLLCLLLTAGCMTPPVVWRHDPGKRRFPPSGRALLVLPMKDMRPAQNEEPSWLNLVPLVLWTTETDQIFERELMRNGTRRRSAPSVALRFDAASDLQRAAARQIGGAGLFGPVFLSREECGPWKDAPPPLVLETELKTLALRQRHLRYGLGPLAPAAFLLGAPRRRVALEVDCRLFLADPDGERFADERLVASLYFTDGWYHSLDAEQRALDELSLRLAERLDDIQEEFTKTCPAEKEDEK